MIVLVNIVSFLSRSILAVFETKTADKRIPLQLDRDGGGDGGGGACRLVPIEKYIRYVQSSDSG